MILTHGANTMVSHLGVPNVPVQALNPGKNLKKFQAMGQKLIVVDPRKTETARLADLHLQIIPGEDATLYAGFINLLFENNWVDQEFCARFAQNVETLRNAVSAFTPDYVANRTGIPVEQMQEAARLFGTANKPNAGCNTGPAMAPDSNLADFLLECMNVLRGGYRRAGEAVLNRWPLSGMQFIEDVMPAHRSWESGPKCGTQDVGHIMGEFPTALLPDEILQSGKEKIRALVVFGGNPAMGLADPEKTLFAFQDLELMVSLDHRLTETGKLSDYVIATSTQYERHDLTSLHESMMEKSFVQYFPPVVNKPDTVVHDWEFFWRVSRSMGLQLEYKYALMGANYGDLPGGTPLNMENPPDPEELLRQLCEEKNLDFDMLKQCENGFVLDEAVTVQKPAQYSGAKLDVCPDDIAQDIERLRNKAELQSDYRLTVRRAITAMNSHYRDSDYAQKKFPSNFAYMNPVDMNDEGLADGTAINIESEHGSIIGIARQDASLRRGVISMSHCFGALNPDEDPEGEMGGHTSRLIPLDPERSESINFMPHMSGIAVCITARR